MIIPISLFFSISVKRKLGFIKFNSAFSISILFPAFLPTFTTFPAFPPLFPAFPPPFPAFPPFPDSSFQLLQRASVLQISESKRCYNVIPSVHYFHLITKMSVDLQICIRVPIEYL